MPEKQEKSAMNWPFIKQLTFSTDLIFLSIFCVPCIFCRRLKELQAPFFFFLNAKEPLLILQNVQLKDKQMQKEVGTGREKPACSSGLNKIALKRNMTARGKKKKKEPNPTTSNISHWNSKSQLFLEKILLMLYFKFRSYRIIKISRGISGHLSVL